MRMSDWSSDVCSSDLSVGDIGRHQSLKDNDKDFVKPDDMLVELRDDNLKLVEALREAKDIVDDAKDNATSGILDDWTDQAEERAWFLFEARDRKSTRLNSSH